MTPEIQCRREGHDPQRNPPSPDVPDPNDPIEGPRGAEPVPDADAHWTPERESTPVTES
jgi:hypothetical protein